MDEPDEQELERRKQEIRARWTPEQEAARDVRASGRVEWSVPCYCVTYLPAPPGSPSFRKDRGVKVYRPLPS